MIYDVWSPLALVIGCAPAVLSPSAPLHGLRLRFVEGGGLRDGPGPGPAVCVAQRGSKQRTKRPESQRFLQGIVICHIMISYLISIILIITSSYRSYHHHIIISSYIISYHHHIIIYRTYHISYRWYHIITYRSSIIYISWYDDMMIDVISSSISSSDMYDDIMYIYDIDRSDYI